MNRIGIVRTSAVVAVLLAVASAASWASVDARMLRYPDVSRDDITFVYAGDIWIVAKDGGSAIRLATPAGEELFPRFSPDGASIAFSAAYDGNTDVYVLPIAGGVPRRLTWHPDVDRVLDWSPDGRSILIASSRESGKDRFNQLYLVPVDGGLPAKLPLPYGEFGTLAADGKTLAYMPVSRDFRTWKRYRGGSTTDIWSFDLESKRSENLTASRSNDGQPMWYGKTLYFLSDRDENKRANIWARDGKTGAMRQVTKFREFDVHFPSIGAEDLVFEAAGRLYRVSLPDETLHEVAVEAIVDLASLRPRTLGVARWMTAATPSPSGKRAVVEARGELFSVPAEHGPVVNLTRTSGVAERHAAWSPKGDEIAYFTDRSGEYDLVVQPSQGGAETVLASLGAGYRYDLYWSPDGRKLAWVDQSMTIRVYDRDREKVLTAGKGLYMFHGNLAAFRASWSPDSRWLAYARSTEPTTPAIFLYDTSNDAVHQVTSGFYGDRSPVFSPDGKYLYFLTDRTFDLSFSAFDTSWIYANATTVAAVPLRKDVGSPILPRNDVEEIATKDGEDVGDGKKDAKGESGKKKRKGDKGDKDEDEEGENGDEAPKPVAIDLDGFESRVVPLPLDPGNYDDLNAVEGKILYRRGQPNGVEGPSSLRMWAFEDREEQTILDACDAFVPTADGKKLLVAVEGALAFVDVAPAQKPEKKLALDRMEMILDPREEWRQIFGDAWRLERDFFYDPNMHGVDWNEMRTRYGALLDDVVTRWDLNFVIGELIGELNSSHAYRGGGDTEQPETTGVGLLGVDWEVADERYRIARIVRGAPWDTEVRSPLDEPGVDVSEGDYLLAVNGVPLTTDREPWAALQGLEETPVQLTVSDKPSDEGARTVVVETITAAADARLRNLAWIERMRRKVDEATDGQVGYIYVPSTSVDGHRELYRMFLSQTRKKGLIVDERFNNGGFIPDRMVELLNRPITNYWAVRDGRDWQWPPTAHAGPKVMLINEWSGSGGDAFPHYFRLAGLGPLIGTTTWGGLIGISGAPGLVDGGGVTVPTFSFYDPNGKWAVEGQGIAPDIEVEDDPALMWDGGDPQLERAIEEIRKRIETGGFKVPARPAYTDRSGS